MELDAACFEVVEEFEQVAGVAAESVEFPNNDFVSLAEALQHLVRLGSVCFGSTGSVVAVDPFAPCTVSSSQIYSSCVLLRAAHFGVCQVRHESPPNFPIKG